MKIAIVGYGRMGHIVEQTALSRGHEIVCRIDIDNRDDFAGDAFRSADVAIEFSRPEAAVENILACFAASVPVVSGTTGWYDSLPELSAICARGEGTMLTASNFSLGVNIFREINRRLADIMNRFPGYIPSMTEIHHIHKLDHPSGTAITLAADIIEHSERLDSWAETAHAEAGQGVLPITPFRKGEVPGIHSVCWNSEADSITLTHSAKNRSGFAEGAVIAAEWLKGRQGAFTMADVLGF